MPEGSRHSEQPVVPDAQSHMRYDDLKPVVRSYVDNLTEQVAELVRTYGVSHPKELIPLMETDTMSFADVKRFGALGEALKVCFENRMPPEAKREARKLREKAAEQYEELRNIFPRAHDGYEMVNTWAPESRIDVLTVIWALDRPLFDDVSERNQTPELQYAIVEALARNGELHAAMDRADRLDPRTFGGVFDPDLLDQHKRLHITIATLAVQQGQFDVAKQAFLKNPENEYVARELIFGLIKAGTFDEIDGILKLVRGSGGMTSRTLLTDLYVDIAEAMREKKQNTNRYLSDALEVIQISSKNQPTRWRITTNTKLAGELIRAGRMQDVHDVIEIGKGTGLNELLPSLVRILAEQNEESEAIRLIDMEKVGAVTKVECYLELALVSAKRGGDPRSFLREADRFNLQTNAGYLPLIECKFATVYALIDDQESMDQSIRNIGKGGRAFSYSSQEIETYFFACIDMGDVLVKKGRDPSLALQLMNQYVEHCVPPRKSAEEVVDMYLQIADFSRKLNDPRFSADVACGKAIELAGKSYRVDVLVNIAQYCIDNRISSSNVAFKEAVRIAQMGQNHAGINVRKGIVGDLFKVAVAKAKNRLDCQTELALALNHDQNSKNSVTQWIHGHLALANVYLDQARELEKT